MARARQRRPRGHRCPRGRGRAGPDPTVAPPADGPGILAAVPRTQAAESTALSHEAPPHDAPPVSPGPSSTGEFAARQRIGRYELLQQIGVGGMGVVFAAYDGVLDRQVAIKLVRSDRADPDSQARIVREGRALARLAHPNVVAVHEVNTHAGQIYMVMEYVRGTTLKQWIAAGRPRSPGEIVEMFLQAGRGLAAAHAQGLVHRDFKPKSRRPSQTAPQPTDRPHSHSQGRFERVDVDRAAPGRPGVPHVLAKRWQRAGPPEDQRGHGPRNTCWCVVGPLPIMTDAVQRFTSAVPRRKPCGQ